MHLGTTPTTPEQPRPKVLESYYQGLVYAAALSTQRSLEYYFGENVTEYPQAIQASPSIDASREADTALGMAAGSSAISQAN